MMKLLMAGLLTIVSAPVAAASDQVVIDFDDLPSGTGDFSFDAFGDPQFRNNVFGGVVIAATVADPAVSGAQVYRGLSIGFQLTDPFNYSWPAIGAFFTSSAPITVTLSAYDYGLPGEVDVFTTIIPAGVTNLYVSFGDIFLPGFFTSALFESPQPFSMDDLTFGLVGVAPGIPEPGTWAMMIGGFALAGAAMRRRRTGISFDRGVCMRPR